MDGGGETEFATLINGGDLPKSLIKVTTAANAGHVRDTQL